MLKELFRRADRLQKSRVFKIVATALVVGVIAVSYAIWLAASVDKGALDAPAGTSAEAPGGPQLTVDALRAQIQSSSAWVAMGIGALAVSVLATIVIWLGLALTYVGLFALSIVVAGPLLLFETTRPFGQLLLGAIVLTASFSVLLQALRALLSADGPVSAIARNVLDEAVRMKIGVVFIVALIFLLAALPGLLDEAQPLRYRMQSFLQYSTTGTFWVLALLTLFFSVATVAFEQRDRLIWQTMVKPVTPLKYLLGKWVGLMTLNFALLSVSATGVFLFVEYLRSQPAQDEMAPFVMVDGQPGITQDRELLETQVLTARAGASVDPAQLEMDVVASLVRQRLEEALQRDFSLRESPARQRQLEAQLQEEIVEQAKRQYLAVPPGLQRTYAFSGLNAARRLNQPLTVRYKINAGSNEPGTLFRLLFVTAAGTVAQQTPLGIAQTFTLPASAIDEDGRLVMTVFNGDPQLGVPNPLTMVFPPDGLEVLYTAGTYEANFLRVGATLWLKLGFIAAVGIASGTFLSFPVACLLTLLVLFAAESSNFLRDSIAEYPLRDPDGNLDVLAVIMSMIASPIAAAFETYGGLRPTANLVEGRLVAWGALIRGFLIVGAWTAGTIGLGWLIFRKRELAIYSGH